MCVRECVSLYTCVYNVYLFCIYYILIIILTSKGLAVNDCLMGGGTSSAIPQLFCVDSMLARQVGRLITQVYVGVL